MWHVMSRMRRSRMKKRAVQVMSRAGGSDEYDDQRGEGEVHVMSRRESGAAHVACDEQIAKKQR
jgi:hypothetical protein